MLDHAGAALALVETPPRLGELVQGDTSAASVRTGSAGISGPLKQIRPAEEEAGRTD
jgi:hypothetical protein